MVAGTGEYNAPLAVQGHGSAAFQQLGGVFRAYQNRQIQPGLFLDRHGPEAMLERLRERMALSRLDLRTDTDLADLFRLLVFGLVGP